jgi:hypothetical protein
MAIRQNNGDTAAAPRPCVSGDASAGLWRFIHGQSRPLRRRICCGLPGHRMQAGWSRLAGSAIRSFAV